jgi:CPA2 family monovalent cation:H+ antiporter-2
MLTVLLHGIGSSGGSGYLQVLWKIGGAVLLLIPLMFAAWKIVPRLLARVQRICSEEISLLLALTICLVVAAITEALGLSLALGAFLGGLLLGSSEFAHALAAETRPLRDLSSPYSS